MNQKEFEAYILENEIPLKGYLNRFAIVKNELEDLYQETWEKAFAKKEQFDPLKSSFKTWLFTIATHQAIDKYRKLNFPKNSQDQARSLAESTPEIEAKLNFIHSQDPAGMYEVKEHVEFCFRCIMKVLKIEKQVTLILADVYLFSNKDISLILNRPLTTIRHYLEDARKEMKEIFEGRCALLYKKGVCDQCSELNGYFNGRQKAAEEKIVWEELKNKDDKEDLYELRRIIVRDINPAYSKGRVLHDYFGWIVFTALKKKKTKIRVKFHLRYV